MVMEMTLGAKKHSKKINFNVFEIYKCACIYTRSSCVSLHTSIFVLHINFPRFGLITAEKESHFYSL